MNWDALVAGAQRALTRTLASSATITYASSQGLGTVDLTGRALFRRHAPRPVQLSSGEVSVQGDYPVLGVRLAELPGSACNQGDRVTVDGQVFEVANKVEDGEGTLDLELQETV